LRRAHGDRADGLRHDVAKIDSREEEARRLPVLEQVRHQLREPVRLLPQRVDDGPRRFAASSASCAYRRGDAEQRVAAFVRDAGDERSRSIVAPPQRPPSTEGRVNAPKQPPSPSLQLDDRVKTVDDLPRKVMCRLARVVDSFRALERP
jgi:hypothetical protein